MSESNSMQGKVVLVTGATSGIGAATAEGLARLGARVFIHGRNPDRTAATVQHIQQATGNADLEPVLADFSNLASVRLLSGVVQQRTDRLDVLLNNAGAMYPDFRETVDGIEQTVAVNHLAPFLLTRLLLDLLKKSAPARVVTVASGAHRRGTLDFDDLEMRDGYDAWGAYDRSKLMNILFTRELSIRLEGTGVTANALSPGLVHTEFGVKDGMGQAHVEKMNQGAPIEQGAKTSIYLASSPDVTAVSGTYFSASAPAEESEAARDAQAARDLWVWSEDVVERYG
jgi:retinol dehydrogenase 12